MSLKGWWPLITNATNKMNLLSATVSGSVSSTAYSKLGSSYYFDGVDDYIALDDSINSVFKGGTSPFTIAFWIYSNENGTRGVIFGDYGLTGTINFNLEMNSGALTDNRLRFYWNNNPDIQTLSHTILTYQAWTHLVITYNGTAIKTYINGSLADTYTVSLGARSKTNGSFYLGRDSRSGATALNCYINDFRIYDSVISQEEITQLNKCLVLHYNFINADTTINDSSGYGYVGTIFNGLTLSSNTTTGCGTSAGEFTGTSGTSNYIESSYYAQEWAYNNSARSLCVWIYPYASGTYNIAGTTSYSWLLRTSGTSLTFNQWNSAGGHTNSMILTGSGLVINTWNYCVVTWDNSVLNMYINGNLVKTQAATTTVANKVITEKLKIGGNIYAWGGTYFYGKIGDFRIYQSCLSANDIMKLYQVSSYIYTDDLVTTEFVEDDVSNASFTNIKTLKSNLLSELPLDLTSINFSLSPLYDNNIYMESDGSFWYKIFHHNNPASNMFASTDTFTAGAYDSVNCWFNVNYLTKTGVSSGSYELMVNQQLTTGGTVYKYRWIQTIDPMSATYAQTVAANTIYNTGSEYTATGYGGLYRKSGNTYLCGNNGTSSNWWGAIGSWTKFGGGIPAWNGQVVTTGYMDLYIRIQFGDTDGNFKIYNSSTVYTQNMSEN